MIPERRLDRPFYLITVVWGRQYCQQFLRYCVGSLLSPGNLPSLRTKSRSKFLIATLPADWDYIMCTAMFRELASYVDPVYIQIPPCPPDVLACVHMGVGHVSACEIAYRDKAYGVILAPDCVISDGTIRNLQEHASRGIELVWVAALRFGEEPFLGHLDAVGLLPKEDPTVSAIPLVLTGRQLVLAGVNGMHSETLTYEWGASYFVNGPSAVWWRVPGEDGIVLHSLSWAPLLLDFAAAPRHDTSALENWTIDGDYVFKNLGTKPKIHVVQDSDEMFYCGWSPLSDKPYPLNPRFTYAYSWMNDAAKSVEFRKAFYSPIYDQLKRRIFLHPVRWHANDLNDNWPPIEGRACRTLLFAIGRWDGKLNDVDRFSLSSCFSVSPLVLARWSALFLFTCLQFPSAIRRLAGRGRRWLLRRAYYSLAVFRILQRLARGDLRAWKQLATRLRNMTSFIARWRPPFGGAP